MIQLIALLIHSSKTVAFIFILSKFKKNSFCLNLKKKNKLDISTRGLLLKISKHFTATSFQSF